MQENEDFDAIESIPRGIKWRPKSTAEYQGFFLSFFFGVLVSSITSDTYEHAGVYH